MASIAHDTIAPLVKDQLYAMEVDNLRDAAFKHNTTKQNGILVSCSQLTFLGYLHFEAFPDYQQAISFFIEAPSGENAVTLLGSAWIDPENAQITVYESDQTIADIITLLRDGIAMSFQLVGQVIGDDHLEIVEFRYDCESEGRTFESFRAHPAFPPFFARCEGRRFTV